MDDKYKGMTVNERLHVAGLMDDYYIAVKNKDIEKAKEILKEVELSDGNIVPILKFDGLID